MRKLRVHVTMKRTVAVEIEAEEQELHPLRIKARDLLDATATALLEKYGFDVGAENCRMEIESAKEIGQI